MGIYVFYADGQAERRADCRNTVVASGADEAEARAAAETLTGGEGSLRSFTAVELTEALPPFTVEGHKPVGRANQSTWPTITRGGNRIGAF
ncbi:hypothetical protein WJS89_02775 [Sphingomicrobium sp. XHP0235]|uniref:hypothetical protein n=1 Tax=Sphingomicrobium aquimarinum TaxID=3133971 RepID=UPI0031FE5523